MNLLLEFLCNKELLMLSKSAFLVSGTIAPNIMLRCFDWAPGQHESCVSGFCSRLSRMCCTSC